MFNKIDLNCYVFLPLNNDKLLLIIILFFVCSECREFQISNLFWGVCPTHVAFSHCYPSLISNDKLRASNFKYFLGHISYIFQIFSRVVCRPHTWPSPIAIPLQYIISQKGPFSKNAPHPTGKSLKKALA